MQAGAALLSTCASGPVQAAAPKQNCDQGSASTGHQLSRADRFLGDSSEPALSSIVFFQTLSFGLGVCFRMRRFLKYVRSHNRGVGRGRKREQVMEKEKGLLKNSVVLEVILFPLPGEYPEI